MLTSGQIAYFETFGFLVLRQLFTLGEVAIIRCEADQLFNEARDGNPYIGAREHLMPFFERGMFMSNLPDDNRIYDIGVSLMGPDFVLDGTEGNLMTGDSSWHCLKPAHGLVPSIKIAFYPDALTKDTGCLRFIPGSHKVGSPDLFAAFRNDDVYSGIRPFDMEPTEIPCYAVESQPGDVVVFTEKVVHASFGGKDGRQQHVINFARNPQTAEQVAFFRSLYDASVRSLRPAESYVNSDRPRIRRMVSRLVELGFETSKI